MQDIQLILQLLEEAKDLETVRIKIFLTSTAHANKAAYTSIALNMQIEYARICVTSTKWFIIVSRN